MQEELVTFQTAKLAKEKGFDWGVRHYYGSPMNPHICYAKSDYGITRDYNSKNKGNPTYYISAPTQSLLQRWLREVHNIDIYIEPVATGYGCYIHKNGDYTHNRESYGVSRNTYEEALEVGLQEALKL